MLQAYMAVDERLQPTTDLDRAVWIDLLAPTPDEERSVEAALAVDVPTRAEMEEIEVSSRLYQEDSAAFMTITVPALVETATPEMAPVTFVLVGDRLVTVRYHEPQAFRTFPARAQKADLGCGRGEGVLIALLEAIVDRLADILERVAAGVDSISRIVFAHSDAKQTKPRDFRDVLQRLGREGDLTSKLRDSLMTLDRLAGFLGNLQMQHGADKAERARLKTLVRDVASLNDHVAFVAQKITFLLDATLGLINIEQNAIIKIVSVAAVVFLPPTLVASIYGMNFEAMPELDWPFGYPLALALMGVSAILPYLYFKRRGWL